MAITSEIIGKLGGGSEVEVTPVEGVASGPSGSEMVLHTVEVPEGETWLVALHGNLQSRNSSSALSAQLTIGTTAMPRYAANGSNGLAHVGAGRIDVKLYRNTGSGSDTFTGHVYAVKL